MDKNSRILFANPSVTKKMGYEISQLNRMKLEELFSPKFKEMFTDFTQLFPSEGYLTVEIDFISKSGEIFSTRSRNSVVCDSNNEIKFLVSMNSNIAKEKSIKTAILKDRSFLEAILDTTDSLVVVLDTKGNIVRFNNKCKLITGYNRSEVLEKPIWDFFIPLDEIEQVMSVFNNLNSGVFPNNHINHWLTRSGEKRLISWSNSVMFDEDGKVEYIIGTGIDITDGRESETRLKESEEKSLRIINNSPFGIITSSIDGKLLSANKAAVKVFGYESEEDFISSVNTEGIAKTLYTNLEEREVIVDSIVKNKDWVVDEIQYRRKDRSIFLASLYIRLIQDNKGKDIIEVFIEDITEKKLLEEEIRKNFQKIEKLNEQLTVNNTILRHDLRNNLTIILGSIDVFLETKREPVLQRALKATQKSEDLIDKMKVVSQLITKDEPMLIKMDVRKLIEEVIASYSELGFNIDVEGEGQVYADMTIKSVFDNLIGNAFKHSESETIDIDIRTQGENCIVEIKDFGKGIPLEYRENLFEYGFKYGKTAGSGLGLYIVKKTLEFNEGSISIEDNIPTGTIFKVKLKLAI